MWRHHTVTTPSPCPPVVDRERHLAETLATETALAVIPQLAADLGADPQVVERLRREYEQTPARPARPRRERRRRAGAARHLRPVRQGLPPGRLRPRTGRGSGHRA